MTAMGYKIFLSHSHRDESLARKIKDQVAALGDVDVFLFQDHMEPGSESYAKIQEEIDSTDALVALVTPNSTPSADVNQEIGYALGRRKVAFALVVPTASRDAIAMLKPLDYISLDPDDPLPGMTRFMEFVVAQRNAIVATPLSVDVKPASLRHATATYGAGDLRLTNDELIAALVLLGAAILLVYAVQKTS
jgi:hypothetical protein